VCRFWIRRFASSVWWYVSFVAQTMSKVREAWVSTRRVLESTVYRRLDAALLTTIHGDPHPDNFMFATDREQGCVRAWPIDFAALRVGSIWFDMAYTILSASTHEYRRDNPQQVRAWVESYVRALQKHVVARQQQHDATPQMMAVRSLVESLTMENAIKGYYQEVATIVVHHLVPFSYSEGCCGEAENQVKSALRTKHRITRDVMIGGVEDLSQAGCHLDVVQWATKFGVVYNVRGCSPAHPEWLALCHTWDSWQQGALAACS